ncbi:MAG: hypothetical protein ACRDUT_09245, partial [Mycobacterium sp.]
GPWRCTAPPGSARLRRTGGLARSRMATAATGAGLPVPAAIPGANTSALAAGAAQLHRPPGPVVPAASAVRTARCTRT